MSTVNLLDNVYKAIDEKNISKAGCLTGRTYTKADIFARSRERDIPLKGFESHYGNLVDYILRCTYDIWEEKNVGVIYTHYSEANEIYTPLGYADNVQSVVDATNGMLSGFPDRQMYSVNIVWDGNEEDGYLSSHINRSIMTNTGDSPFGKATGKSVDVLCIADCLCKDNLIIREWLVRDSGAMVKQLGLNIEDVALKMATADVNADLTHWYEADTLRRTKNRKKRPVVKALPDNAGPMDIVATMLHNVWSVHNFAMIDDYYSFNVSVEGLSGNRLCGTPNLKRLLTELHSTLSDSDFEIDHIQMMDSDAGENEKFVHCRWTLCGKHATSKMFGQGTGVPLHIMGISQYRIVNGRIAEEWTVFDEVAIWKQIKMAQLRTIAVDSQGNV